MFFLFLTELKTEVESTWLIILKRLFVSGSVNIVNNPHDFVSKIIQQYSRRYRRIIINYYVRRLTFYFSKWLLSFNYDPLNIFASEFGHQFSCTHPEF